MSLPVSTCLTKEALAEDAKVALEEMLNSSKENSSQRIHEEFKEEEALKKAQMEKQIREDQPGFESQSVLQAGLT